VLLWDVVVELACNDLILWRPENWLNEAWFEIIGVRPSEHNARNTYIDRMME